jgi:RNA recognition motif-containing protein
MMYDHRGLTTGYIHVVMSSPEEADRAMHELNGVPLYTKTVKIVPYMKLESRGEYSLSWGWYANKSNSLKDVRLRYPHTTPPRSIFDSYRESRSIAILRDDLIKPMYKLSESLYGLLHAYDVLNTHSVIYKYSTGKKAEQRSMCEVVFATTEAADTVCQVYNGTVWHGSKLTVGLRRPPTRLLGGSWEASHNRAHYQPRDLGSAKGTNLEKVTTLSHIGVRGDHMLVAVPADVLTGRRAYVPEVDLERSRPRDICGRPSILNPTCSMTPLEQARILSAALSIVLVSKPAL